MYPKKIMQEQKAAAKYKNSRKISISGNWAWTILLRGWVVCSMSNSTNACFGDVWTAISFFDKSQFIFCSVKKMTDFSQHTANTGRRSDHCKDEKSSLVKNAQEAVSIVQKHEKVWIPLKLQWYWAAVCLLAWLLEFERWSFNCLFLTVVISLYNDWTFKRIIFLTIQQWQQGYNSSHECTQRKENHGALNSIKIILSLISIPIPLLRAWYGKQY